MPLRRTAFLLLFVPILWAVPPASAGGLSDAKVALHVQPRATKGLCVSSTAGGQIPDQVPPSQYRTSGFVGVSYNVYLLGVAPPDVASFPAGLAGLSCGIEYDPVPSRGVDVFGWTSCADSESPSSGAYGSWPAAGSGNRLTWSTCQNLTVPGFESEGLVAVAGSFYVYAYGADSLEVTRNLNLPAGPELSVADCDLGEAELPLTAAGFAAFSADGTAQGCNPVLGPCSADGPPPVCSISPPGLDFGNVAIGEGADRTFVITNTGGSVLDGLVFLDSGCSRFSIVSGAGAFALAAGDSHEVVVRFTPTHLVDDTCILATGVSCADVVIHGTGIPECELDPQFLDFGTVEVGQSYSRTFTLRTNRATSPLTGEIWMFEEYFFITAGRGPFSLEPGDSLVVEVTLSPTYAFAPKTLSVFTGTDCGFVDVRGGASYGPPVCGLEPDTLDFGTVTLGSGRSLAFTVSNTGASLLLVTLIEDCEDFSFPAGDGPFGISSGASRQFQATFIPLSSGGKTCVVDTGTDCAPLVLMGEAVPLPPACDVAPADLDFGEVEIGAEANRSFTVTNAGGSILSGTAIVDCPEFAVLAGTETYALAAGESHEVTVRFTPATTGPKQCVIDPGAGCDSVRAVAAGLSSPPACSITPTPLGFGYVPVGGFADRDLVIANSGGGILSGNVAGACTDFQVLAGAGPFTLGPGQTRTVSVRFAPSSTGFHECTLELSTPCGAVSVRGMGYDPGVETQPDAVIALHVRPHDPGPGEDPCSWSPADESRDCPDFTTEWPVYRQADIYLLVARGESGPGIGGLTCGLRYNNGDLGGPTRADARGVDLYSWQLCSADLEYPRSPTEFPEDAWPASGGGIRIAWDPQTNCRRETSPADGVMVVAGALYVFAYSPDLLQITPDHTGAVGPVLQVEDCDGIGTNLDPSTAAGAIGFGGPEGYTPCDAVVPVRLISFTADREPEGAVLRWETISASAGHLGFEVHRGIDGGGRERISHGLLSGRTAYAFTDPAPPAGETEYWLAERSRAGTIEWHGPAILPPAATGGRLAMTQPPANPFVTSTRFSFRLPEGSEVRVRIFDTAGREVARPFAGHLSPGEQTVEWNGRDDRGRRLSAGAYLYRIETAFGTLSGKVIRLQ